MVDMPGSTGDDVLHGLRFIVLKPIFNAETPGTPGKFASGTMAGN
jgi:hypothetical protein